MAQTTNIGFNRPVFENLNGLRFVGALTVLLFHCFTLQREIWGDFYKTPWFQAIFSIANKGHLGVNLFFVLSGFLITYLLLDENLKTGRINIFNFLLRRFLRIWPVYFLVVLFGFYVFPLLPFGIGTIHEFWRFSLFLSNFDEIIHGANDRINFLSATWSVSIEEQFYLVWGILLGAIPFKKAVFFPLFFLVIIVSSILFRSFYWNDARMIYFHTFSVMSDLAIGGIIGYLAFNGKIQPLFERLKKWHLLLFYLFAVIILLSSNQFFEGAWIAFERVVIGVLFACIILEQVYAKNSFYKIDKLPYFFAAGELTYGFYMFHCVFIYYWSIFFKNHGYTDNLYQFSLYILLVFFSTYALAWFSFHYFERPILSLKKYFR
jgi:peptidoglycan/LPS O-acetylase OafA/YrhL